MVGIEAAAHLQRESPLRQLLRQGTEQAVGEAGGEVVAAELAASEGLARLRLRIRGQAAAYAVPDPATPSPAPAPEA